MKIVKKIFLIALMIWFTYIITVSARTATVNTDGARMRREPNTTSDVLTVVYNKETVEIIEKQDDWYRVKYGEYEGYIREDLMDLGPEDEAPAENEPTPEPEEPTSSEENNSGEEQQVPEENTPEVNVPEANAPEENNNEGEKPEENNTNTTQTETFEQVEKTVKQDTSAKVIPSFSASSILELKAGEKVLVTKQMNKWYCIEVNNKTAWVLESCLSENGEVVEEPEEPQGPEEPENPEEEPQEEQGPTKMYINVSAAVLRAGPSTSSDAIAEMYMDRSVEILGEDGDWYKVKYEDKEGYVAKRLLSDTVDGTHRSLLEERSLDGIEDIPPLEIQEPVETVIKTVYVNTAVANLREGSSTDTAKVGTAKRGEALEVLAEENGWYKIKTADGTAYILQTLTSDTLVEQSSSVQQLAPAVDSSSATGDEVVAYAKQFLGYPYVYGGAGPSSFDCSGFTKYVYGHFGIALSHSASAQSNNGTYVQKSELKLGDLVIFRDWDNTTIGHCGIYVGGGRFIHAANASRGVVTDTLNSGYYYERYVSGRRLF